MELEKKIEDAYWLFDGMHKGHGPHRLSPCSERGAFKCVVRHLLDHQKSKLVPPAFEGPVTHQVELAALEFLRDQTKLALSPVIPFHLDDYETMRSKADDITHESLLVIKGRLDVIIGD